MVHNEWPKQKKEEKSTFFFFEIRFFLKRLVSHRILRNSKNRSVTLFSEKFSTFWDKNECDPKLFGGGDTIGAKVAENRKNRIIFDPAALET